MSRTLTMSCEVNGVKIHFLPASAYCYTIGFNVINTKERQQLLKLVASNHYKRLSPLERSAV